MNYRYIAIEGNIGSGKTTLATRLANHYNAKLILEQFEDNPFLSKFYEQPQRYAFPLELAFLADRYNQLKGVLPARDMFQDAIVSDYIFTKTKLFARINLQEDEYELFQRMADIIKFNLPKPDLLIYLHAPIAKLKEHIVKRGRPFEQKMEAEYLEKVQHAYQQYLKQEEVKVLMIETDKADFLNDDQFQQLTDFLDKDYSFDSYFLAIR